MKRLLQTASLSLLTVTSSFVTGADDDYGYGAGTGYAAQTLDERVARLEKKISSQGLVEMVTRLDRMQSEVAKLHGRMEELQHHIETLQKQQQGMVSEIEQRIAQGQFGPMGTTVEGAGQSSSDVEADVMSHASPASTAAGQSVSGQASAGEGSDGGRQSAYQKAFALLKDGKYDESIKEFKSFVQKYPKGEYADQSLYWLGEAQYVNRDFSGSRDTFRKLIRDFPQNGKLADAQLKLGYIEYDLGDMAKAKDALNEVVKRYPASNAARLAEKRLEKIKTDKH